MMSRRSALARGGGTSGVLARLGRFCPAANALRSTEEFDGFTALFAVAFDAVIEHLGLLLWNASFAKATHH
jgi:hypothetical protein